MVEPAAVRIGGARMMSFDRLARHYRWMEFALAGGKLQRCRTAFLDEVGDRERVLVVGEGNGRFVAECRRRLARARILCVDASARMVGLARARVSRLGGDVGPVEFVVADLLEWRPPESAFDLVVTNFFLDCFQPEELGRVVGVLSAAAMPEATWLLADFTVPERGLGRFRALLVHRLMYMFFRAATGLSAQRLTEPDALLEHHDFKLRRREVSEWGLLHSDRWERTRSG